MSKNTCRICPANASDQKPGQHKLLEPEWGNLFVSKVTSTDAKKLPAKIATGRARPSKTKPNNCARKLQGPKLTPIRANGSKMFTLAVGWKWHADNGSRFQRLFINAQRQL